MKNKNPKANNPQSTQFHHLPIMQTVAKENLQIQKKFNLAPTPQ
jgi:hypothetical protein